MILQVIMANYTSSKNESDQIATLLATGSKLDSEDKQATLPNLIRGSLNSMLALMEKQKEQITTTCLNQDQEISQEYEEQFARTTTLVREVELVCHQQNLRDLGKEVTLKRPLLTTLYDHTDPIFTEAKIKSSDMRQVKEFDAEDTQTDLKAETFLNEVVDTGRQCKLNEEGLKSLLMARLTGTAKQIVTSHLQLHKIPLEDIKIQELVGLIEHHFCPLSQPRQATIQLMQLPKLPPGDFSFLKLQATVSRLAKISTLETPEQHRDVLLQSRALDAFQNCLQPNHKALIVSENQKRHNNGLSNLTLSGVTQFLIQQTTLQTPETMSSLPYSVSSTRQVTLTEDKVQQDHVEDPYQDDPAYVYYVHRGRGRGNFRPSSRYQRGRSSFRGRGSFHPPGNQNVRFQNIQRGNFSQQNRFPRQRGRGEYFTQKRNNQIPQLSNHQMGIANKACWKCGMLSHNANDQTGACYFSKYPLTKFPCQSCGTGLHHRSVCLGANQEAQEAFKKDIEKQKQSVPNRFPGKQQREVKPDIGEIFPPVEYNNDLENYLEELENQEN